MKDLIQKLRLAFGLSLKPMKPAEAANEIQEEGLEMASFRQRRRQREIAARLRKMREESDTDN